MNHEAASTDVIVDVREKGNLDRSTIVATALRLLDEVGIEGLSTRRLAAELGIKSASLYWHFKDKDELLNEMSSMMFVECLQAFVAVKSQSDALEWLAESARVLRRVALSRRDGAQVMARPMLRAPANKAAFEDCVRTLVRAGVPDMEARVMLQTLRRLAIGTAIQEQTNAALSAASGIVCTSEEAFELGLQIFIEGVKVRIAAASAVAHPA